MVSQEVGFDLGTDQAIEENNLDELVINIKNHKLALRPRPEHMRHQYCFRGKISPDGARRICQRNSTFRDNAAHAPVLHRPSQHLFNRKNCSRSTKIIRQPRASPACCAASPLLPLGNRRSSTPRRARSHGDPPAFR